MTPNTTAIAALTALAIGAAPASASPFFVVSDSTFTLTIDAAANSLTAAGAFAFTRPDGTDGLIQYAFDATIASREDQLFPGSFTQSLFTFSGGFLDLSVDDVPLPLALVDTLAYTTHPPPDNAGAFASMIFFFEPFALTPDVRAAFGLSAHGRELAGLPRLSFRWTPGASPTFPLLDGRFRQSYFVFAVPEPAVLALFPVALAAWRWRRRAR